ncbi:MAG: TlpA family protein disulfide reductase [Solirubrobacterales bacterium]|nr:TlpA family protein disulfide reductase [Solirubrobacterales bacterium]
MKLAAHRRLLVLAVLCAGLLGLIAGCGSGDEDAPPPPDYAKKLAGSPAPLAALHEQGNELLSGGLDAYDKRIESLKGFPVVVNVWASWCGPCRQEFPYFQQASANMGKKVAFLGVNAEDADDLAGDFLADHPVPYPSYTDPKAEIAGEVGGVGYPRTVFYDANGKLIQTHSGGFPDQASLDEAIQQYAVEGRSG